jgi:putative MATE family efflux protein
MQGTLGRDLTTGSIPRHLLSVTVPMLIGNLLNTGYSIINTIWVGKIIGEDAVGATAISFPIVFIFVALAAGATMATTILVSQYYGAKNLSMVQRVVNTSFGLSLILGILLTIAGISFSEALLRIMHTPAAIFPMAASYLKISFVGFVFMFFSFLVTSILRGIGDTRTPLAFMAIGVVLNAILDPLLIIGIGPFPRMGLNGAALASVLSAMVAVGCAVGYLNYKGSFVAFNPRRLMLDKTIIALIFKIGFPSMIQQSLISLGGMFITTFVNGFGSPAIAAFGAAGRIESLAFMPAMTLSMAVSTLTGQNIGAGKPERVQRTFRWGLLMILTINTIIMVAAFAIPGLLLRLFISDPAVIAIGVGYLRITAISYVIFGVMFVSNGVIMGTGHTLIIMIFTITSLWVVRVPLAAWLSHTSLGLSGIWISIVTSFTVTMIISLAYYSSGRWKKMVIKHAMPAAEPAPVPVPAADEA